MTDPTDAELRAEALDRFTRGPIHLPPEIADSMSLYDMGEAGLLDGIPEVHWDVARHYAEPDTEASGESITDKLTAEYLRPMLEAHGVPNPEKYQLRWEAPPENLAPLDDTAPPRFVAPMPGMYQFDITFSGINPAFLRLLGWWEPTGRPALDGRYRQRQRNRRRNRR